MIGQYASSNRRTYGTMCLNNGGYWPNAAETAAAYLSSLVEHRPARRHLAACGVAVRYDGQTWHLVCVAHESASCLMCSAERAGALAVALYNDPDCRCLFDALDCCVVTEGR